MGWSGFASKCYYRGRNRDGLEMLLTNVYHFHLHLFYGIMWKSLDEINANLWWISNLMSPGLFVFVFRQTTTVYTMNSLGDNNRALKTWNGMEKNK